MISGNSDWVFQEKATKHIGLKIKQRPEKPAFGVN